MVNMAVHIWSIDNWKMDSNYNLTNHRTGLRARFEPDVDLEVRRACKEFCKWIRKEYFFPVRVSIYFKSSKHIKASDGERVSAIFYEPYIKYQDSYIKIAVGDYADLLKSHNKDDALAIILCSISHELTHYFQWVNGISLTSIGRERQATMYSRYIVDEYAETREHP